MNVFVTGATGFVGREIVAQLHAAGRKATILARNSRSKEAQDLARSFGVQVRPGDVLQPDTLASALAGCDTIIHLVGIISEAGGAITFEKVHVEGARNIVRAAKQAAVKRYLHMSALGTRPGAVSRYHKTKWEAEEVVRSSGLAFTIFRPSLIYGAHDQFVNQFAQMSRWSAVLPVMGQGTFQPIPVELVAQSFVRAIDEPLAVGQTYDLVGGEILTFEEILDQILSVTGRKRLKMPMPLPFSLGLAGILKCIYPTVIGKAPPLNRDQLIMLQEQTIGSPQPAWTLFGFKPEPFKDGIAKFLKKESS